MVDKQKRMALITVSLTTSPALAADSADAAGQVIGSEGGKLGAKEGLNGALKLAKSKHVLATATGIVCLTCIPLAGAVTSPALVS